MNPIAKILGPLSNIIGGLLGGITPRTAQSIKKGYLFFIDRKSTRLNSSHRL
jgi:hypothetical protein